MLCKITPVVIMGQLFNRGEGDFFSMTLNYFFWGEGWGYLFPHDPEFCVGDNMKNIFFSSNFTKKCLLKIAHSSDYLFYIFQVKNFFLFSILATEN